MTQKPMLRVEAGARVLRMLVKDMCGWTERASAGVQGTCVPGRHDFPEHRSATGLLDARAGVNRAPHHGQVQLSN